jgi:thiol-disulfide isomerase/thioredoxin
VIQRGHLAVLALAVLGALGGLLAGQWLQPRPGAPAGAALVGHEAPALRLPDPQGRLRDLGEWKGRLLLVNFWASWCPPCVQEMPLLDRVAKRDAAAGLTVVGVAADGTAATRGFLAAHPVTYPILIDDPDAPGRGRDASEQYGNTRAVLPYSVLVDRSGRIVAQHAGSFTQASLEHWLAPFR